MNQTKPTRNPHLLAVQSQFSLIFSGFFGEHRENPTSRCFQGFPSHRSLQDDETFEHGIALTRALKENIFAVIVAVELRLSVSWTAWTAWLTVGRPGGLGDSAAIFRETTGELMTSPDTK